jgi:hypothetical protein
MIYLYSSRTTLYLHHHFLKEQEIYLVEINLGKKRNSRGFYRLDKPTKLFEYIEKFEYVLDDLTYIDMTYSIDIIQERCDFFIIQKTLNKLTCYI